MDTMRNSKLIAVFESLFHSSYLSMWALGVFLISPWRANLINLYLKYKKKKRKRKKKIY